MHKTERESTLSVRVSCVATFVKGDICLYTFWVCWDLAYHHFNNIYVTKMLIFDVITKFEMCIIRIKSTE